MLVAGSPQGGALTQRGSEDRPVGQQSLSELRLTVQVGAAAAVRHAPQLHRFVEGVVLGASRCARCRTNREEGGGGGELGTYALIKCALGVGKARAAVPCGR